MPLVLQPLFKDEDRHSLEEYLKIVRAKRMAVAAEFFATKNQKIEHLSDQMQRKMANIVQSLNKNLERMETLEDKINEQLVKLTGYQQELGLLHSTYTDLPEE